MSEGSALTHFRYKLNINDLANQFSTAFLAEWIAGRTAQKLRHSRTIFSIRTAGFIRRPW